MNLQNLTPYEAGDGRTAERRKGGLISGYNRLKKHAWQDVFSYKMLEYDINDYVRKNQNKPIGKKRMAELKELAHRKAENLAAKMLEVNEEKHLVRRVPVAKEIQKMVDCAKELPGVMTY